MGLETVPESTRALVVDRFSLFTAAIAQLLAEPPVNARVRTLTRTDLALQALEEEPLDLALCEVQAQPVLGPAFARLASSRHPECRVILLGGREDEELLVAALRSGASGFFTKDTSPEGFVAGVQAVLAGHLVVGGKLATEALAQLDPAAVTASMNPRLTGAEQRVLALVGQARTVPEIASERGITEKTVRNHLRHIYRKLELKSRTEAMLSAVRLGLVKPENGYDLVVAADPGLAPRQVATPATRGR